MSKVSVRIAAELTGKTRETINKATNAGTLSFTRNASNHKQIEIAELERVYPLTKSIDEINQKPKTVNTSQPSSEPDNNAEIATLREKLAGSERTNEMLSAERERERRQLESEIDNLRASLEKAHDQHNKAMLLITDQTQYQSREEGFDKSFKALEARIANQEQSAKEGKEKAHKILRQNQALKKAIEEEQNKTSWQKIFG